MLVTKQAIEELAKQQGETDVVSLITKLQAAAAKVGDWHTMDALCEVKWEFINV